MTAEPTACISSISFPWAWTAGDASPGVVRASDGGDAGCLPVGPLLARPRAAATPGTWSSIPATGAPWTAVTAIFLHGSWLHLLGNLLYLQVFGPPLEDRLGPCEFLVYFLIMGVAGNLVHGVVSALDLLGHRGHRGAGGLGRHRRPAGLLPGPLLRRPGHRWPGGCWRRWAGQNRAGRSLIPMAAAAAVLAAAADGPGPGGRRDRGQRLLRRPPRGIRSWACPGPGHGRTGRRPDRGGGRPGRAVLSRRGNSMPRPGAWTEYLDQARRRTWTARLELARCQSCASSRGSRWKISGRSSTPWLKRAGCRRGPGGVRRGRPGQRAVTAGARGTWPRWPTTRRSNWIIAGALEAYRMLYEAYPDHPAGAAGPGPGHRAVPRQGGRSGRGATVARGGPGDQMPPGSWRDYLEREFKLAEEPREAARAESGGRSPDNRILRAAPSARRRQGGHPSSRKQIRHVTLNFEPAVGTSAGQADAGQIVLPGRRCRSRGSSAVAKTWRQVRQGRCRGQDLPAETLAAVQPFGDGAGRIEPVQAPDRASGCPANRRRWPGAAGSGRAGRS